MNAKKDERDTIEKKNGKKRGSNVQCKVTRKNTSNK